MFIVSSTTLLTSLRPLNGPITETVLPCTIMYVCVSNSSALRAVMAVCQHRPAEG